MKLIAIYQESGSVYTYSCNYKGENKESDIVKYLYDNTKIDADYLLEYYLVDKMIERQVYS